MLGFSTQQDAASFCADAVAFADSSCLLPTPRHRRATTHNPGVDTGTGRRYGDAASFCADAVARVDTRVDTGTQLLCRKGRMSKRIRMLWTMAFSNMARRWRRSEQALTHSPKRRLIMLNTVSTCHR
jgi:hypothetical protein